jgi:hypothetical protein
MSTRAEHDRAPYSSMDEALTEIRRLRDEVRRLREELNDPLVNARAVPEDDAATGGAPPGDAVAESPRANPVPPAEPLADAANEWTAADPREHAALARLERLRDAIVQARVERERAVQELRTLVEQGTAAQPPVPVSPAQADPPPPEDAVPDNAPATPLAPPADETTGSPVATLADDVEPARAGHVPAWGVRHVAFILGTAIVVALATFLLVGYWARPRTDPALASGAGGVIGSGAAAPTLPAPADTGEPAVISPATAALRVELRTERESWLRVSVDGERRVERLVPGGQTFVLDASSTVLVRAGDAGAVTVSVNGAPAEIMGRDGRVADRTYTALPAAR